MHFQRHKAFSEKKAGCTVVRIVYELFETNNNIMTL